MREDVNSVKAYITVFFVSLLFFYEFGLNNIFNALQSHIAAALNISATKIGLVSSIFFYIEIILLIPAGILLDRFSPKGIIITVICISAVGVIITACADHITALVIGRILMGIGGAFSFIGCIRIAVNCVQPRQIAKSISLIVSIGLLGGFVVQIPLTLLINSFGWRDALIIVTLLGFLIALLIFLFVKENVQRSVKESIHNVKNLSIKQQFKNAFLNKQNILCGAYNALMNLPIFMLGAMWGIAYLQVVDKFTEVQASTICGMLFLGIIIGSPLASIVSDAIGSRVKPMKIGAIFSFTLIIILIFFHSQNFCFELFMFLLLGIITSIQNLSYPTVIESNPRSISSSATAVISLLCMLGGAISQPLFGWIVDLLQKHYNDAIAFNWAISILPIAFIFSYIICFFIKETNCKSAIAD